jgi:hypothetical protein
MIGSPQALSGCSARPPVVARSNGSLRALASFRSGTKLSLLRRILLVAARLRRFANETVAASIAHHAQQASPAQHPPELPHQRSQAIHHGPLDQLFAWAAARFGKRPKARS